MFHNMISPKGGFPVLAENTRNHIFFQRNQSSDNRSHGSGAKFLLKKLSASDFSYERKSAVRQLVRWPSGMTLPV